MSVTTDKEGHKHYRMKADTGYLGAKTQQDGQKPKAFNFFIKAEQPLWRFQIQIPGFKNFGRKKVTIQTEQGESVIACTAFTLFGTTFWRLPKDRPLETGKKYKVTLKQWKS